MREDTAEWIGPLIELAVLDDISIGDVPMRHSMPAVEAAQAGIDSMATLLEDTAMPAGAFRAVDWIAVGVDLVAALGLDDYPPPPGS